MSLSRKKTFTSLLHHTKHTKHHDKMVLLSRIKNLNKRTETTGSFYFLLVLQNHWLGPLSAILCKNTSDIHHYTIGPQNEVIVILMRVLNDRDDYEIECCCLIKDLRLVVQFRLVPIFIFQCSRKLNSAIFADLIDSAIRSWVASVNLNIACQCNL